MKKILLLITAILILLTGCEKKEYPSDPGGIQAYDQASVIEQHQLSPDLLIAVDTIYTVTEGEGTTLVYSIKATNSGADKSVMIKGFASGPNLYNRAFDLDWRVQLFYPMETKAYAGQERVYGITDSYFEIDIKISYDLGRSWKTLYNIRNLRHDDDF